MSGKSKKSGKPFDAYILMGARVNSNDKELNGMEVKQIFLDKRFLLEDVKRLGSYAAIVGMSVDINYDDGGFVESAQLISKQEID